MIKCYDEVAEKYKDMLVVVGETGWPSADDPSWSGVSNKTIASELNQLRFYEEFTQLAHDKKIKYFYFDAFDEEFKWTERKASGNTSQLTMPLDRTLVGNLAGSSWGIFYSNGQLKHLFRDILFVDVPSVSSRTIREVFARGNLSVGYDMGVDSSEGKTDWLTTTGESMRMSYPSGQSWGSVFITVGKPVEPPRPWKDFSQFQTLSITIRGEVGGESVQIGLKDAYDPDNGTETTIAIKNISSNWQTLNFSLLSFDTADLQHLYVPAEFVFSGSNAETIYFKDIAYTPARTEIIPTPKPTPTPTQLPEGEIYAGEKLSDGYDMGVASSKGATNWVTDLKGSMRMSYPSGQSWGSVFITVGKPVEPPRPSQDFSLFKSITLDLKGEVGGESVQIGLKDANDADDGSETKVTISNLSTQWQTYSYPLSLFVSANTAKLYVVTEFVFSGPTAQTVYFRNIKYQYIEVSTPTPSQTPTPPPVVGDNYEPDNSFIQHSTMDVTSTQQAQERSIDPAGDNDYISFYAKPGIYVFYTSGTLDTYGYLYDSNQRLLMFNDDGQSNLQFRILYNITVSDYYVLRVRAYNISTTGSYTLYFQYQVSGPETFGEIYVGEKLSIGYDMGVDSSNNRTDWLSDLNGSMRMSYPSGQTWGAVFITVGPPTNELRLSKDMSLFQNISMQLRGESGGESIQIGLKDASDLDYGTETKLTVSLSSQWQTYTFPLSSFTTADLKKLYVVTEFVFPGSVAETVYFRNIEYT